MPTRALGGWRSEQGTRACTLSFSGAGTYCSACQATLATQARKALGGELARPQLLLVWKGNGRVPQTRTRRCATKETQPRHPHCIVPSPSECPSPCQTSEAWRARTAQLPRQPRAPLRSWWPSLRKPRAASNPLWKAMKSRCSRPWMSMNGSCVVWKVRVSPGVSQRQFTQPPHQPRAVPTPHPDTAPREPLRNLCYRHHSGPQGTGSGRSEPCFGVDCPCVRCPGQLGVRPLRPAHARHPPLLAHRAAPRGEYASGETTAAGGLAGVAGRVPWPVHSAAQSPHPPFLLHQSQKTKLPSQVQAAAGEAAASQAELSEAQSRACAALHATRCAVPLTPHTPTPQS